MESVIQAFFIIAQMSNRNKAKLIVISGIIIILFALVFMIRNLFSGKATVESEGEIVEATVSAKPKEYLYEFDLDSFSIVQEKVRKGDSFSNILLKNGVGYPVINKIEQHSKDIFNLRSIRADQPYTIFFNIDSISGPAYLVYESNVTDYVVFDLTGNNPVEKKQKPTEIVRREAKGTITSSLYDAFLKNDLSISVAMEMSEIFAWTVDFYKVQKNDAFKIIFYEKQVEGKTVGVDRIEAAVFEHYGKPFYAFRYKQDGKFEYFDEEGQSVRKMFLKAPLKFSRISSRYNLQRFHPVLKTVKPHLGTDYAAPTGTPIMTVGDGVIEEAGYTAGNGNYVKVRHNSVYTTQYLHMSKFGAGIKKGKRVKQGEVIGYVGSTGLATGPHLCFRFWKNGKQVDPLKEKPIQSHPIKEENLVSFKQAVAALKPQLDLI